MKRGGLTAPFRIHDPLGPIFYPIDKANINSDYLENLFAPHDLCDYDHKRQVEARIHTLLATIDEVTPLKMWPCDV
jgi:hypothetical protein